MVYDLAFAVKSKKIERSALIDKANLLSRCITARACYAIAGALDLQLVSSARCHIDVINKYTSQVGTAKKNC
jgi:hypothetical protein